MSIHSSSDISISQAHPTNIRLIPCPNPRKKEKRIRIRKTAREYRKKIKAKNKRQRKKKKKEKQQNSKTAEEKTPQQKSQISPEKKTNTCPTIYTACLARRITPSIPRLITLEPFFMPGSRVAADIVRVHRPGPRVFGAGRVYFGGGENTSEFHLWNLAVPLAAATRLFAPGVYSRTPMMS